MKRSNEYVGFRNKICDLVTLDNMDWFDYRKGEDDLPNVGAFCRKCATETAKPMYPIYMNGKEAYALRCSKCGSEYPMYKGTFKTRYIGSTLPNGGRINPTHGTDTIRNCMDRKAKAYHDHTDKVVEDNICKGLHISHEEYKEMKKKWDEDQKKAHMRIEAEIAKFSVEIENEKINKESEKRKELIEKGALKYVKGVGLVNTETNEIVKF